MPKKLENNQGVEINKEERDNNVYLWFNYHGEKYGGQFKQTENNRVFENALEDIRYNIRRLKTGWITNY